MAKADDTQTDMMDGGIRIAHAIPGRVRFKIPQVREDAHFADRLRQRLASLRGVQLVETNTLTGSVLILYDPTATPSPESLRTLIEPLAALFPGIVLQELESWAANGATGYQRAPSLAENIRACFARLNRGADDITGGSADLRTLVPVTLFLTGIQRLITAKSVPAPTWYDYLWFAFSTYFILNASKGSDSAAAG